MGIVDVKRGARYPGVTGEDYEAVVETLHGTAAAPEELPLVHRVASLPKAFVGGIPHGRWTKPWLPQLLEEFAFRFNRRNSRCRPSLCGGPLPSGVRRPGRTTALPRDLHPLCLVLGAPAL